MIEKAAHIVGASSSGGKFEAHCTCGWRVTPPTFRECFDAEADHLHANGLKTFDEELAASDKVRPFSNGTEFRMWSERNCERCRNGYDVAPEGWKCPIEKAIGEGMFEPHGAIDRELAVRGGLASDPLRDCPEREVVL